MSEKNNKLKAPVCLSDLTADERNLIVRYRLATQDKQKELKQLVKSTKKSNKQK